MEVGERSVVGRNFITKACPPIAFADPGSIKLVVTPPAMARAYASSISIVGAVKSRRWANGKEFDILHNCGFYTYPGVSHAPFASKINNSLPYSPDTNADFPQFPIHFTSPWSRRMSAQSMTCVPSSFPVHAFALVIRVALVPSWNRSDVVRDWKLAGGEGFRFNDWHRAKTSGV